MGYSAVLKDSAGKNFWRVYAEGNRVQIIWGAVGGTSQDQALQVATEAAAEAMAKKLAEAQKKRGFSEHAPSGIAKHTEADDHILESQVDDEPDDPKILQRYSEWLLAKGDVRGALAKLQREGSKKEVKTFIEQQKEELFESLASRYDVELLDLTWQDGFVLGATLIREESLNTSLPKLTERFLTLPVSRFIRSLRFGFAGYSKQGTTRDWSETFMSIAASPRAEKLQSLGFDYVTDQRVPLNATVVGNLSGQWDAFPSLKSLSIRGSEAKLGEFELPSLSRLQWTTARWARDELTGLEQSKLPRLSSLYLDLEGAETPAVLMKGKAFSTLSELIIRGAADDAIATLISGKLLKRLRRLELSGTKLSSAGVESVVKNAKSFAHLESLVITGPKISAAARKAVTARLPNVSGGAPLVKKKKVKR